MNNSFDPICNSHGTAQRLHNMSCQARATITRKGQNQCRRVSFNGSLYANLADWCRRLKLRATNEEQAVRALQKAASNVHGLVRLPPVAPALNQGGGDVVAGLSDDLLIQLAVLSRCSDRVFIRRRPPLISAGALKRSICLIVPLTWEISP